MPAAAADLPRPPIRPRRAALWLLAGLLPGVAGAQTATPDLQDAAPGATAPAAPLAVPLLEIVGFDLLLNAYNRKFSGTRDYDVTADSIRDNLRGPWVTDNDPFQVNQFAHPYQGSLYHGAARATGHGYWTSAAITFAGSLWWEITGERTPPSKNDQVASGIAGSFFGEPLYRMARRLRAQGGDDWRRWLAAAVSPPDGLNQALFGSRYDAAFDDHDPWIASRLRVGASRLLHDESGRQYGERTAGELDGSIEYGLPGKPGYGYERPFDYFAAQLALSTANGVEYLASRGLLGGAAYGNDDPDRPLAGVWGLWGSYDYSAPQIYNLSTTALSIGTTLRWQAAPRVELQGTALGGLGYAAVSTRRRAVDDVTDRRFRYGTAPRLSLAGRMIVDDRAAVDVATEQYWLGRIANRRAGHDDISRVEASLTWRVTGPHAVGVRGVWSQRSSEYADQPERRQSVASIGVYYTLLGSDGFGGGFATTR